VRRSRQGTDNTAQQRDLQALLEKHAQGHETRHGTAHREIVDGAMDRERNDVAAREFERLHSETVRGHDQLVGREASVSPARGAQWQA
jgi:hypothetical protein